MVSSNFYPAFARILVRQWNDGCSSFLVFKSEISFGIITGQSKFKPAMARLLSMNRFQIRTRETISLQSSPLSIFIKEAFADHLIWIKEPTSHDALVFRFFYSIDMVHQQSVVRSIGRLKGMLHVSATPDNIEDHPNSENKGNQVAQNSDGWKSPTQVLNSRCDNHGRSHDQRSNNYRKHKAIGTSIDWFS